MVKATLAVALLVMHAAGISFAEPVGSPKAQEALAFCDRADDVPDGEKAALLDQGLLLAERAEEADPSDAAAHFAVFCNLGKRTDLDGTRLRSLLAIRRLRRELDVTLALAPDDSDALAGKGALLLNLPRLLGGSAVEAERLLRWALAIDPKNKRARQYLAQALTDRGARDEAEALRVSR